MTLALFHHFAVFPEDVGVPLEVFVALTKTITGCDTSKKTTMQIRASLKTLLKHHLLKGSTGSGVLMHDIVRDYTISQLGEATLREKQIDTARALLDARPEGGFVPAEHASPFTLEGYVARQLAVHFRASWMEGEAPPSAWMGHEDEAVLRAMALAVGYEELVAMAAEAEAAGDYLLAARYSWVGTKLRTQGRLSGEVCADLHYRAADLLARIPEVQRDDALQSFEQVVLSAAVSRR